MDSHLSSSIYINSTANSMIRSYYFCIRFTSSVCPVGIEKMKGYIRGTKVKKAAVLFFEAFHEIVKIQPLYS